MAEFSKDSNSIRPLFNLENVSISLSYEQFQIMRSSEISFHDMLLFSRPFQVNIEEVELELYTERILDTFQFPDYLNLAI